MTTTPGKAQCITCGKERSAVRCEGCLQIFCYNHLTDHRQQLNQQLDEIEVNRDIFRQTLTQQITDSKPYVLIKQIDQWEEDSLKKIQQIAEESRQLLDKYISEHLNQIEGNLNILTEELRQTRRDDDFNEIDLNKFKEKLTQFQKELDEPTNILIQEDLSSPVNKISVIVSSCKEQQQSDRLYTEQNADNETEVLRKKLNEVDIDQQTYIALKASYTQLEKRCVKHQKAELEVKRQIAGYQSFINDLQREIQDLMERLSIGAEEYRTLSRKYTLLQSSKQINHDEEELSSTIKSFDGPMFDEEELASVLRNTYEPQEDQECEITSARSYLANTDDEVKKCPMCYYEFPVHMNVDAKRKHIEHHFQ